MSEPRITALPIVEVTLLEDRARVRRRATLTLDAGAHRLLLEAVSPVLVDKTLAARIDGVTTSVRVTRESLHLAADQPEARRALDAELEAARDVIAALERRLGRLRDALELAEVAAQHMLSDLRLDAQWGAPAEGAPSTAALLEEHATRLQTLQEKERALAVERLGVETELRERRAELSRLQQRRAAAAQPSDEVAARLVIDCDVAEAGERTLEVDYVVPAACWRPAHRATFTAEGAVAFESEACVWQNTGEDWPEVTLRFSTQRASLGAEPPRLSTEELRVQRKNEVLEVETREQTIEQTGVEGATRAAPELPGIDDGGDALELRAPDAATIPSDGRPRRVPLFEFEASADAALTCAPELTAAVLFRTRQDNPSRHPLLAGPVDLVKGGGHIGSTSILYVAPGERFELGWGPDPALRVHRTVVELEPESSLLRNWHYDTTHVKNRLSNLGPERKELELVERVPVSEIEKVKIEVDPQETTEGEAPDDDGFLRWTIVLEPFARATVELRSTTRRHSDVVF